MKIFPYSLAYIYEVIIVSNSEWVMLGHLWHDIFLKKKCY